jgi:NADH-quinone oxidoreductase subunit F
MEGLHEEVIYGRRGFRISIPIASCTVAGGAREVYESVVKEVESRGLDAEATVVGCMGLDYIDPWIRLAKRGLPPAIYANVNPGDVGLILSEYLSGDISGAYALMFRVEGGKGEEGVPTLEELDVWSHQVRFVSRNCGLVNPESIDEYMALGGYEGLKRSLRMEPAEIIDELKSSGLRGRGGAGFPTWLKWKICLEQPGDEKYVIANCDEGDPGAFMNRLLAESDPHRILEGLIIAGYTIGACKGFIFVRAEKPLAASRLLRAVDDARTRGLLGDDILGEAFRFDVEVFLSAGAFVCGEETAMIAAIEGGRATPRQRPPYPAVKGLWGKPTIINNVETLAHVATIMMEGWSVFASMGTERSKGTKMYCVTGSVRRTGAYEVPIGMSIGELVYEIAGGPPEGRRVKAVQVGGPSGGCIPSNLLDLPLDYESLQEAGAIMGSGGIVVIDDGSCMVDIAKFFIEFTAAESCGQCIPGRVGTRLMLETLRRIVEGEGEMEDLVLLEEIGLAMKKTCLCALGQTAPNPILTTLRYFKGEYLTHIEERRCPTLVCKALISYRIDEGECRGCGLCAKNCPAQAISGETGSPHVIDQDRCFKCGTCLEGCPSNAIVKVSGGGGM